MNNSIPHHNVDNLVTNDYKRIGGDKEGHSLLDYLYSNGYFSIREIRLCKITNDIDVGEMTFVEKVYAVSVGSEKLIDRYSLVYRTKDDLIRKQKESAIEFGKKLKIILK